MNRKTHQGWAPSKKKYVDFYRKKMPQLDPELFGNPVAGTRFADFGAAHGGMSEYLVKELGWQGHASSLAVDDGGFAMQFEDPKLSYHDCDMAREGAWDVSVGRIAKGSCLFVNAGIVVDGGQSKGPDGAEKKSVHIYINELICALHALASGGALYFAFQPSAAMPGCAGLFRLLLILRPYFSKRPRITPTSSPDRKPLYCYLGGFKGLENSRACIQAIEALKAADLPCFDAKSWSKKVQGLYDDLRDDLHYVWNLQRVELKKKREEAERRNGSQAQVPAPSTDENSSAECDLFRLGALYD
mmetsp:Transcript_29621/g.72606  ORF Transcript_29621/g.72606 Transcript_29621/m.72606 type:complete len:301 (-) Transcript_29621:51-953(-)